LAKVKELAESKKRNIEEISELVEPDNGLMQNVHITHQDQTPGVSHTLLTILLYFILIM